MRGHRSSASPLASVSPMAASPEKTLPSQIHLVLGYFSLFYFLTVCMAGRRSLELDRYHFIQRRAVLTPLLPIPKIFIVLREGVFNLLKTPHF